MSRCRPGVHFILVSTTLPSLHELMGNLQTKAKLSISSIGGKEINTRSIDRYEYACSRRYEYLGAARASTESFARNKIQAKKRWALLLYVGR